MPCWRLKTANLPPKAMWLEKANATSVMLPRSTWHAIKDDHETVEFEATRATVFSLEERHERRRGASRSSHAPCLVHCRASLTPNAREARATVNL